jgi:hypothetical protein
MKSPRPESLGLFLRLVELLTFRRFELFGIPTFADCGRMLGHLSSSQRQDQEQDQLPHICQQLADMGHPVGFSS